ncbi:MAG TPA: hypothetical protein VLU43_17935 [Anaeromyxobacteraceae bacterium]|nr:hypothetical protein [Anaeromyxobacteraceae bacterium]
MPVLPVAAAAPAVPAAPLSAAPPTRTFGAVLEGRARAALLPQGGGAGQAPLGGMLEGLERAQRRLDAVLAAARQGRTFTAQELLGLQAEAYRCTQTVDLTAKLVEAGAQSVRQAVNTPL